LRKTANSTSSHAKKPPNQPNPPNRCKRLKARRGEEEVPQEERARGESNKL
jgi:hypothetical protein